jgi:hypothetical protein
MTATRRSRAQQPHLDDARYRGVGKPLDGIDAYRRGEGCPLLAAQCVARATSQDAPASRSAARDGRAAEIDADELAVRILERHRQQISGQMGFGEAGAPRGPTKRQE